MTQAPGIEISKVKALIFDVDGTLSDSDDRMVEQVYEHLGFLGSIMGENNLKRFSRWFIRTAEGPGNWVLELADRLGMDHLIANFFDHRANQKEHLVRHYPLIPGVFPMLQALSSRYPFAIVTARNEVTTRHFLNLNNLDPFFPIVISSQTCRRTKPFPDPLLHAASRMNIPIENCLMIGDTVTDVRAALSAGAQSLSVLCGFGTETELIKSGTQEILPSTSMVADFLSGVLE